jgi:uncharacterized protein (TIGR03437 family)
LRALLHFMSYSRLYSILVFGLMTAGGALPQIVLDTNPARTMGGPNAGLTTVTNLNPDLSAIGGMDSPSGIALDTTGSAPILYVADTVNNRILAWKNATSATLTNLQKPDMVIGQPDFYTTLPGINAASGPSRLNYPSGLLVDSSGNLYVADSGNNRILRFPTPFGANNNKGQPDVVLGQPDPFTSRKPNQDGAPAANTIYLSNLNGTTYTSAMALDGSGNLYVVDAGNDRVLGYPAASLKSGNFGPAATILLGQAGFASVASPIGQLDLTHLYIPSGVAIDSSGNIFVTDAIYRIMVYAPPASNAIGPPAIRIGGFVQGSSGVSQSSLNNPGAVVMLNNGPAVADSGNNRILIFDAFSSADWTVKSGDKTDSTPPPVAIGVIGQADYVSGLSNQGQAQPSATTLSNPAALAVAGTDVFVVDTSNHRVLVYPNSGSPGSAGGAPAATVVLGQAGFPYSSVNAMNGTGFWFTPGVTFDGDAGIVVDSSSATPHLYISDPNNNRVLGFADARMVGPGVAPDLVLGEPDFVTPVCNYGGVRVSSPAPGQLATQPTQSSLCYPTGLAVDSSTGDLYVADSENSRVLRFPAPFASGVTHMEQADLVLGQSGFTGLKNPAVNAGLMGFPYGLVFDQNTDSGNGLLVSDYSYNRVLFFEKSNLTAGNNGIQAAKVIGQSDFVSQGNSVLNQPHHIAVDSNDRIYVADSGHGQVLIFDSLPFLGSSTTTSLLALGGLYYPEAVSVLPIAIAGYPDDIWIGDHDNGVVRYARYGLLNTSGSNIPTDEFYPATLKAGSSVQCPAGGNDCVLPTLALTQDGLGNLYIADGSNRVGIHYPALATRNAANFLCAGPLDSQGNCTLGGLNEKGYYLAPGAVASTFEFAGLQFVQTPASFCPPGAASCLPVPTTVGGVQVLVNAVPSPIFYVDTNQINFVVPKEAPTSGTATLQVIVPANNQVLASGTVAMNTVAPAFFTTNQAGTGQMAAINCNDTPCETTNFINSASNPVVRGGIIELFGTGQGLVSGMPPDGQLPGGDLSTPVVPNVFLDGSPVPSSAIQFSGLAPNDVGLWQLNIIIPSSTAPGSSVSVLVSYENYLTFNSPNLQTNIAVK